MPTPKSVIKYKKGTVEYTSSCDAAQYYIYELSRAALRDVAKFVVKKFRDNYYSVFHKWTGNAGKATKYKVISGKSTQFPRVQIGLKTGKVDGFYSYFQEFGTSKTPKYGLLTQTVEGNVAEIVKIESKYLSGLESEAQAQSLIASEDDYEGDADE